MITRMAGGVLLGALALSAPAGGQAPAPTVDRNALAAKVEAYLAPLVSSNNFSGVVLVARRGEPLFRKAYGYANVEHRVPNTPATVFHVASVSKTFTSAAIMLLAERGKIDLDAPLSRLLPDYPRAESLTVHHLLAHTSGIPNINEFPEYESLQFTPQTPAGLVARFKDRPLEFPPGARYRYSNSNYNLLALLIERVTGTSYGEFLRRELLEPHGLKHTAHRGDAAAIVPGLAEGYAPRGTRDLERARYIDWTAKIGNGSLITTADDLLVWVRALHAGRVLSQASLDRTFKEHTPRVGYGWFLTRHLGRPRHHINGRSPGWSAQVNHYPGEDVTVILLSNLYIATTSEAASSIGAMVFGAEYTPMPQIDLAPLVARDAERLVGRYQFGADYYVPNSQIVVVSRGGHLYGEAPGGTFSAPFLVLTPTRFISRPFWSNVEFSLGADGKATEMKVDGFRGVRVE
jgi:CubicO group peptidase (beta-lactamase class C family)